MQKGPAAAKTAVAANPGLTRFLTLLERKYGNISDLVKPKPVITTDQLHHDHLEQVRGGKIKEEASDNK